MDWVAVCSCKKPYLNNTNAKKSCIKTLGLAFRFFLIYPLWEGNSVFEFGAHDISAYMAMPFV